jgi:hypothetical protein
MTRTIPALTALAVTLSLLVFALLQRGAVPTAPATLGACLDTPAAQAPAPVVPAAIEVTSCGGDATVLASAEAR